MGYPGIAFKEIRADKWAKTDMKINENELCVYYKDHD